MKQLIFLVSFIPLISFSQIQSEKKMKGPRGSLNDRSWFFQLQGLSSNIESGDNNRYNPSNLTKITEGDGLIPLGLSGKIGTEVFSSALFSSSIFLGAKYLRFSGENENDAALVNEEKKFDTRNNMQEKLSLLESSAGIKLNLNLDLKSFILQPYLGFSYGVGQREERAEYTVRDARIENYSREVLLDYQARTWIIGMKLIDRTRFYLDLTYAQTELIWTEQETQVQYFNKDDSTNVSQTYFTPFYLGQTYTEIALGGGYFF
jgi:hypothetical protein